MDGSTRAKEDEIGGERGERGGERVCDLDLPDSFVCDRTVWVARCIAGRAFPRMLAAKATCILHTSLHVHTRPSPMGCIHTSGTHYLLPEKTIIEEEAAVGLLRVSQGSSKARARWRVQQRAPHHRPRSKGRFGTTEGTGVSFRFTG